MKNGEIGSVLSRVDIIHSTQDGTDPDYLLNPEVAGHGGNHSLGGQVDIVNLPTQGGNDSDYLLNPGLTDNGTNQHSAAGVRITHSSQDDADREMGKL